MKGLLTIFVRAIDFRKFKKRKRAQFVLNTAAGLLIVLLMHGLESTSYGERTLNQSFDRFIKLEAMEALEINGNFGNLLLIDIQNHKYNEPEDEQKPNLFSPRDTIARLVEIAIRGSAKVIVLGFSFEEKDCCHPDKDEELRKVLEENKNKKTKIIFPVKIGSNDRVKKLIFDDQIDKTPNYVRAISTLYASTNDAIVRYWKAFQQYDGNKILWSIPVLAVAMSKGKEDQLARLESLMIQKDKKFNTYTMKIDVKGQKKNLLLPVQEMDLYLQRIRFRLIPKDCISNNPSGNIPIRHLTKELFENKLVIIGNSDPAMDNLIATPVGHMTGIFIQANVVQTLLNGLQIRRAPWWVSVFIDIFIIVCTSYLFHHMRNFWIEILITFIGIGVLGPLGYYLVFKNYGIFPNFVFGIAAIGYIEHMNSLKECLTRRKRKKIIRSLR